MFFFSENLQKADVMSIRNPFKVDTMVHDLLIVFFYYLFSFSQIPWIYEDLWNFFSFLPKIRGGKA
ncbi:hypothetical protein Gferi_15800 [Geosporobacter ferrireducens]|uniref:Uncharacterized protein n=1 Tax=Geosporobacter ferrireducens TaxID=1424294 RepID=A0A1D8GJ05_9FIRM|nr:hypothetical protein Gferi_15800 [Geosporobacter ferrireducens]